MALQGWAAMQGGLTLISDGPAAGATAALGLLMGRGGGHRGLCCMPFGGGGGREGRGGAFGGSGGSRWGPLAGLQLLLKTQHGCRHLEGSRGENRHPQPWGN